MWDFKTFLFMDEEGRDYCSMHQVRKVRFSSKLDGTPMGKGFICPKCEMGMMEYETLVVRKNEQWIPMEEYAKNWSEYN
jgi:hypothetical protein